MVPNDSKNAPAAAPAPKKQRLFCSHAVTTDGKTRYSFTRPGESACVLTLEHAVGEPVYVPGKEYELEGVQVAPKEGA